jgi:phage terminase large subunit GpA-like protein
LLKRVWKAIAPPPRVSPDAWAERYRHLSSLSYISGQFTFTLTPFLREPLQCLVDRAVRKIVGQKPAQIGWTEGFLNNCLGWIIDVAPAAAVVLFPKKDAAKEFNEEKFEMMVDATPRLARKVSLKSREKGVTQFKKNFVNGFIKFVWSNSPNSVKSTSAPWVFVEEPDDCSRNVKGQGNAIRLISERNKTYRGGKVVFGGSPTVEGLSEVADAMEESDKRRWMVPCHVCGVEQYLTWEQVRWNKDPARAHPIFGPHLPESARYECIACQEGWTASRKDMNVRRGRWVATAPFHGVAGFYFTELMSGFPGSRLDLLVEKFLIANKEAKGGDWTGMIAFYNSTLGLPWAFKSTTPTLEELAKRAAAYDELTVPLRASVVTISFDVQHDRLAVGVEAWGRGEENWLVYWGEIHGSCTQKTDPVWDEAERWITRAYRHELGVDLYVEAAGIDSSDGQTSDAVYDFVRRMKAKGVKIFALKGSSSEDAEIYRAPTQRSIDPSARPTKASRYGVRTWPVGTGKAKDILLGHDKNAGRINVVDDGPGKIHWYRGVRGDWLAQFVDSEIKAPKKGQPAHKKFWQKKSGRANEALDNKVYNLYLARVLRLNLKSEAEWDAIEQRVRQGDLLTTPAKSEPSVTTEAPSPAPAQARSNTSLLSAQLENHIDVPAASEESRPW